MSDKRDFLEVLRLPGWAIYIKRIQDLIRQKEEELRTLEIEGKTSDQIGIQHLMLDREIAGLKHALLISEIIKNEEDEDI